MQVEIVVNLPANVGNIRDQVQSLGREDPLEEGLETHSSIPAWRIPMDRVWQASSQGHRVKTEATTHAHTCTEHAACFSSC